MKPFNERPNVKPTISVVETSIPYILVSSEAITKMQVYVHECNDEIGWLGTATYDESTNEYKIHDVYLFEQDVHATTTEITPDGLSSFAEDLLARPDGMEIWNNLKVWGHSHVDMGVTPSGQDNDQMKTFAGVGHEWFIRLIANKKGEMKFDLYHYGDGIAFFDVPWQVSLTQEEEEIQAQIAYLQGMLNKSEKERISTHEEVIKKEMKEKVRKKQLYTTPVYTRSNLYGEWINGKWVRYEDEPAKKNANASVKIKETDVYYSDQQVVAGLGHQILLEISTCFSIAEAELVLEDCGYLDYFSEADLERIYRVAQRYAQQ